MLVACKVVSLPCKRLRNDAAGEGGILRPSAAPAPHENPQFANLLIQIKKQTAKKIAWKLDLAQTSQPIGRQNDLLTAQEKP
jgi:hypothetical protein